MALDILIDYQYRWSNSLFVALSDSRIATICHTPLVSGYILDAGAYVAGAMATRTRRCCHGDAGPWRGTNDRDVD